MSKYCSEPGCGRSHYARDLCKRHWQQKRRAGLIVVDPDWRKAPKPNRAYNGSGTFITKNGYRKIRLSAGIWILEHRHVMEQLLGRALFGDENVHHRDGDRLNNDPGNLELWVCRQPQGQRVDDVVEWAREILNRYEGMAA